MRVLTRKKGFASLIGFLITVIIIALSLFLALKIYTKGPSAKKKAKIMEESGIDSSSHKGILESTKSKIDEINKEYLAWLNKEANASFSEQDGQ